MAQRRRRAGFAGSDQKRPVDGQRIGDAAPAPSGMTSSDARTLGVQIDEEKTAWRTNGVRLVQRQTCCVVVRNSQTGEELELHSRDEWTSLTAPGR